ncbi:probable inactive receptor kinase At3g08680 [Diospyros lotus]|uniref:probable inactive receptor kinase At3g08680 n=1 Tax=Diospyros lotus TaxID=55363 RepID=UPI0022519D29|nr:probable inactive receptor kinase At3g08680 [Diospyros lotus]
MLSRAFTKPSSHKQSPRNDEQQSHRSVSIHEYEDCIFGFMDIDVPLIVCDGHDRDAGGEAAYLTLREVLRASVGMIGEGLLGMTEKVVLDRGRVCAVKRFRKLSVRRGEFGRSIQRLALASRRCQYLVPVRAYMYAKRMKFVVSDYYPMGSLADLLDGARKHGHTALGWNQRLTIILNISLAIAFIHSQSPGQDKRLPMNVHGNIKPSNVLINVDFTACLSDYGLAQLAERLEVSDTSWQLKPPPRPPQPAPCATALSQENDIYNFGVIMLDLLGGIKSMKRCSKEERVEIRRGKFDLLEAPMEGKGREEAMKVFEVALACTDPSPEARPSIDRLLFDLGNVCY